MSRIRLEWVPIQIYNLGLFGFDHLQLTYEQFDMTIQDEWFVIEGIRGSFFLEALGEDGQTTLAAANPTPGINGEPQYGQDLVNAIGTPWSRGSRALPVLDPFNAWVQMAANAADIEGEYAYSIIGIPGTVIPSLNSSSLIASLMYYAGIDISNHMPFGMRRTSGTHTLLGTQADNELTATENFSAVAGGRGSDILRGTDANERFYGGMDNDLIVWSKGSNLIHGGQYMMAYALDGIDTVDYSGAGTIVFQRSQFEVENAAPRYIVRTQTGAVDHLYSIERVEWSQLSDTLQLEDVEVLEDGLLFNMGAESTQQGDRIEFASLSSGVLINPTSVAGELALQAHNAADPSKASWIESAEWIVGSGHADEIYFDTNLRVVEGGGGDDLIDARLATAFEGSSPLGYDAELLGGAGNDTLVANAGRSKLVGGDGNDRFVLTAMTSAAGAVEMEIEGGDAGDRLYIPYAFFDGSNGAYDGSELMPVLGGIGEPAPGVSAYFDWRTESQRWYATDLSEGVITFVGMILFSMEGSDLLVRVFQGEKVPFEYDDGNGGTYWVTEVLPLLDTETIIRIKGFQEGQLGINFYDPGTPSYITLPNGAPAIHYPNYDSIVHTLTADGARLATLAARPTSPDAPPENGGPAPEEFDGGPGDDNLFFGSGPTIIDGGAGNDAITTGDDADMLDGGSGTDTLTGGAGNDTYIVDQTADSVIEAANGGSDTLYSSVDITLPAEVETLILVDAAIAATGNAAANTLGGNELANVLAGAGGDDLLVGAAGNDTLTGGTGNDRYGYSLGDGNDRIRDLGATADNDVLLMNAGIAPLDVTFARAQGAPQDLILQLADGSRITMEGFATSAAASVDAVHFSDDTHWTRTELLAFWSAAPSEANAAPVAVDDPHFAVTVPVVTIPKAALLANDTDVNGDTLSITSVGDAVNCTVALDASGDVVFTPAAGVRGVASFTYTVSDGHGGASTATVEIAIGVDIEPSMTITGTSAADLLTASAEDETLTGLDGNDTLDGGYGADTLDGGDGIDLASYASALWGVTVHLDQSYPDTGDAAGDSLISIEGVIGSPHDDAIVGDGAGNLLRGEDGGDDLYGQDGNDTLQGGAGSDGLNGGTGNDSLIGGAETDTLHGDDGDDLLDGHTDELLSAYDELAGGTGNDTYVVGSDDVVFEWAGQGSDTVLARADYVLNSGAEIEILRADTTAVTSLAGNEHAQLVTAAPAGTATLIGGGGADTVQGGLAGELMYGDFAGGGGTGLAGADLINGGDGNDTIHGEAGGDTLYGDAGNDDLYGGDGNDTLTGLADNDLVQGDAGDDLLNGSAGNDTLIGGAGLDVLYGNTDNDLLDGATNEAVAARDTLAGGSGNDTYIVQGNDIVQEAAGNGTDTLLARSTYALAQGVHVETLQADAGGITLTGNELAQALVMSSGIVAQLRGGGGNDTLTGGAAANTLWGDFAGGTGPGTAGNDSLAGGGGNDTLNGEAGNDTLLGEANNDRLNAGTGDDTADGGDGNDSVYGQDGNDLLYGSAGNDMLSGGNGADTLFGGDGIDTLWGDAGNDTLTGGTGVDRFTFRAGFGSDIIQDFAASEILDVRGFGASYADLVFTPGPLGLEISSAMFGVGNVIVIANASGSIDASQFLFA